MINLLSVAVFYARLATLERYTYYGPDYNRGVVEHFVDALGFASKGEPDAVERCLLRAEVLAGLISPERYYDWEDHQRKEESCCS
jgi:hypothetical protein